MLRAGRFQIEVLELLAGHDAGGDLREWKSDNLRNERHRARGARVHFQDIDLAILDGVLHVHQSADIERERECARLPLELRERLFAQRVWRQRARRVARVSKVVRVEVDQDRARALGISSQALSQTINAVLSGTTVTQLRDDIYLIDIVARAVADERVKLETLRSLMINVPGRHSVPLEQVAKLSYGIEPPLVWRRHRLPTVTVQADTAPGLEAATVVKALSPDLGAFKSTLPAGYDVVAGGTVEESAKAEASIFAVFPLMILIMITILMVQLQSFQRLFLVLATAPLALIGVAAALLVFHAPMGFVAILGVVSLIGMVIRNSVILIDQIDTEIASGQHPWNAVIVATEHRLRPILLTAAAAILGMIPIAPTVFWGPMAYAVMGGLVVATLLTLVFLPALYVAWFRIQPEEDDECLDGRIARWLER